MTNADIFGFVGVTATQSSINRVFPRWARVLDLEPVEFAPVDLELDTDPDRYREVVVGIRDEPRHRGALVTSHKVHLLSAARDLFDELDQHAELLGEVSCIAKDGDRLLGFAKDPITAGRSLEDFVPAGHFTGGESEVLCLGAGGAGLAIAVHLLSKDPACGQPQRVTLVNRSQPRLDECDEVLRRLGVRDRVELVRNEDPDRNDDLVADLPAGSLVVNATGMGKDRPGSPVTDRAPFPVDGLAWELNYRGELDFLHQARRQAERTGLTVEDGWRYFIHGWSEVVAEVFNLELPPEILDELSDEATKARS